MDFEILRHDLVEFVKFHAAWAPLIVGVLAFCESLAVLSLLVPATVLLIGIGALIGATGLAFWPIWLGAAFGAALGDWLSYAVGVHFKERVKTHWPFNKNPETVQKAERLCHSYGGWGIFVGRFFGPLRAIVPLVAGILGMPALVFQAANVASAMLWAFVLLAPGAEAIKLFQ